MVRGAFRTKLQLVTEVVDSFAETI